MAQLTVDWGYLNGTSNGGLKIYKYLPVIKGIYTPQVRVEWEYLNGTNNGGMKLFKWNK